MNERRRGEYKAPHASTSGAADEAPVDLTSGDNQSPEQALEGRRLEAALGAALDALSPRERAAFAMARFEGLPYKEIAAALDASEPAIKSLIHRATLSVAKALQGLTGAAHVS
jgi:RNA polymerase sigma-70 factor (ECF subfamily)